MVTMMVTKLVRNKVPQAIRDRGEQPLTWIAVDGEYKKLLRAKLLEEVKELLDSNEVEELADILEVVWTIAHDIFDISNNELEQIRVNKSLEWGDYSDRHVLSYEINGSVP